MTNFSAVRPSSTDVIHPLDDLPRIVQADLDGIATDTDRAVLEAHPTEWVSTLRSLRRRLDGTIGRLERELAGPERDLVLDDFYSERERIDTALHTLTGERPDTPTSPRQTVKEPAENVAAVTLTDTPQLQLTVTLDAIAAFSAAPTGASDDHAALRERLAAAGAPTWRVIRARHSRDRGVGEALAEASQCLFAAPVFPSSPHLFRVLQCLGEAGDTPQNRPGDR